MTGGQHHVRSGNKVNTHVSGWSGGWSVLLAFLFSDPSNILVWIVIKMKRLRIFISYTRSYVKSY
jgi:hypothetical protein